MTRWRSSATAPAKLASDVVAADHFVRGVYFPQSVFGVLTASHWRWLEHAGWVVFENVFLIGSCVRANREMRDIAERTAELHTSEERYRSIKTAIVEAALRRVVDVARVQLAET